MIDISPIDYQKLHFMTVGNEMQQIASPLKKYGITYFSFSRFNRNREETFLTSRVDAAHIWFEGKFYEKLFCDDVDKYFTTNVLWDDISTSDKNAAVLLNAFAETSNVANGICLIKKYDNYFDQFYFAAEKSNYSMNLFYLNNIDLLDAFIAYFYERAQQLISDAYDNRIYTPGCIDHSLLTSEQLKNVSIENNQTNKKDFILDLYELSRREKQCVMLLASGKRAKTIAKTLNLSQRTVENYLISARKKTSSASAYELLLKVAKN